MQKVHRSKEKEFRLFSCPVAKSTYNTLMACSSRKIRLLVVAGLLLSLGMVGLWPALMAGVAADVALSDATPANTCCCGTTAGECCGMACCGVDAPKQQRTPVPHGDHNELQGSFWLACCKTSPGLATVNSQDSRGAETESAAAGVRRNTLQALHVLLQT